ncbi:DNA-processing protein DprA [Mycoplasmopsis edwardii]|uniref:DNA-processing protein DprA n=1 Tax=Mycoplasmopsis edwardii TaxID=53558 RepID=A0ACD4PGP4_9BACT|nr:DNA-processing protein DprA [Mycoplasmopsis edwardii]WBP83804.1 DNA-processing protein DprA [Mycoplasmopsis edwardii]
MNKALFYYAHKNKGNNIKIFDAIKNIEKIDTDELNTLLTKYKEQKVNFVTILDYEYPSSLLFSYKPPFVLFYRGNIDILKKLTKVYLVNEVHNQNTETNIQNNIEQLTKNTTLVTNGYKNTEAEFIKEYRKNNGKIIHIAKGGIDSFNFDNFNEQNELVISQYPIESHPKRDYFKQDNYLASLLADQLIYFSSIENSKTHNLVNYFLNVGKDISCFPGVELNDGNNHLIKLGARMITYIAEAIRI